MVASTHSRWLAVVIVACGLFCSTGCSIIGVGIGAAVPNWRRDVPPASIDWHGKGERPLVDVQADQEGRVVGSYGGLYGEGASVTVSTLASPSQGKEWDGPPGLVVMTGRRERRIPLRDIERVDVRTGSYWATGLGVGFAIDLTVAVVLAVVAASMIKLNFGGFSSSM